MPAPGGPLRGLHSCADVGTLRTLATGVFPMASQAGFHLPGRSKWETLCKRGAAVAPARPSELLSGHACNWCMAAARNLHASGIYAPAVYADLLIAAIETARGPLEYYADYFEFSAAQTDLFARLDADWHELEHLALQEYRKDREREARFRGRSSKSLL